MLKNVKAIIFDMDGTLIDSTNIWAVIDKNFFEKRNMEIPDGYADSIAHVGLKEAAIITKEKYGIKETVEEIEKEWEDASIEMYENTIPLKEGVFDYLNKCKKEGIKMAVATANRRKLYIPCLQRLNVIDFFDVISDVELVHKGKEDPKLFDYVAEKLNINKDRIAVFEDSIVGIQTAKKAGYYVVAVYDNSSASIDDKKKESSDIFIRSFKELL